MASSTLAIPGLISGLSTQDIVQKLMDIERQPLLSMQNDKDKEQKRIDALREINSRLSALLTKIQTLNLRSTIDTKTVTSDTPPSLPTLVTASADSTAALGSFTVRVLALATATTVGSASGPGSPSAIGNAVQPNQPLASAGFAVTPTIGTFSVNGATITIDSNTVLSDGTDLDGANTIFAKIRQATGGQVTVSWGLDADGRQNKLVLTSASPIQLGSGSDTSNFLTAAGLAGLPPATTVTSSRNLGGVNTSALLSSSAANLNVPLSATGSFKINGVEIAYDATKDTLSSVVSRINSSAANVTASYDSLSDRLILTSRSTGSTLISLEDVSGNFLAAMKLSPANETVGSNASYLLNGVQRYSASNTVTDAVAGVTLNLKKADPLTDVTLTVSQDTSSTVTAVQDFVDQYNNAMDYIRSQTAYDPTSKNAGVLAGDSTIQSIENTLAILVGGFGDGFSSTIRSLSDIGISTGAIGSAVGSTDKLVLDKEKLTAALQDNPSAVADIFGGLVENVALTAGGTGSVASVSGTPTAHVSGSYTVVSDGAGNLTATFTPSGGGATTTTTGTITAGGINTTLIPGITITAKSALVAGTDTITVDVTTKGVGVKVADYLKSLTSSTGVFASRIESATDAIKDMDESIRSLQERLDEKQNALYAKFNSLEVALARLQDQSASLMAQLAGLNSGA